MVGQSVGHFIAPAEIGGAETVVLSLVSAQRRAGIEALIVAHVAGSTPHPFVERARALGLPVVVLSTSPRNYLAQASSLVRTVRTNGITLMHTHGLHADIVGDWASRRAAVPMVSTLHGFIFSGWKDRVYDVLLRRVHQRAAGVIAVSLSVAERLVERGVSPDKVFRIPNVLSDSRVVLSRREARARLGISAVEARVGWVGRLSFEKGADIALEAFAQAQTIPGRLSIIGDGPERGPLEAKAQALGVAHTVDFHGAIPDAATLLRAFDLLVLSSRSEGLPLILLEAIAAEVPIVATRVGGVPEILGPAEALLVPPERADLLADALRSAWNNPAAAKLRATYARLRLDASHSESDWVAAHERVYRAARPVAD